MAPRPNAKKKFSYSSSEKVLALNCRWQGCNKSFALHLEEYQTFAEHVLEHCNEIIDMLSVYENDNEPELLISYKCQWNECSWEISNSKDQYTRHVLFHAYHSRLKCLGAFEIILEKVNQCGLDTETEDLIPDTTEPFQCKWEGCGMKFLCPDKFYRHVEMHGYNANREGVMVAHGEEGKLYSLPNSNEVVKGMTVQKLMQSVCRWQDCSFLAKSAVKIKDHCRTHTGERQLACPRCGAFFSNKTKYIDHLTRQNIQLYENFQCSHCLKRCASERLLRDHMRHHVNHVKCPHCDMTCANPSSLRSHIKFRHSMHRPYKCAMCDYSCKTSNDLKRHEETHFDRRFQCEAHGCSFLAKTLAGLRSHFKIVHKVQNKDKFMCHICQRRFSRGYFLTKHLKSDHNFSWPSGHSRFRYKQYEDGFHRLQMVRFESAELTEQLTEENRDLAGIETDLTDDERRVLVSQAADDASIQGINAPENASSSDTGMENLIAICSDLNSLYDGQTDQLSLHDSSLMSSLAPPVDMTLSKEYAEMLPYYASGGTESASVVADNVSGRICNNDLQFANNSENNDVPQVDDPGSLVVNSQACVDIDVARDVMSTISIEGTQTENTENCIIRSEKANKKSKIGHKSRCVPENVLYPNVESFEQLYHDEAGSSSEATRNDELKGVKISRTTPKRKCRSLYCKETSPKGLANKRTPENKGGSSKRNTHRASKRQLPFSMVDEDAKGNQNHVMETGQEPRFDDIDNESTGRCKRPSSGIVSERPDKRQYKKTNAEDDVYDLAEDCERERYEQVILDVSKTLLLLQNSENNDGFLL